ncbi:MAG TPA: hypothetical protein VFU23_01955 [Gemmatimonadales bacterium]|nr:hypothetical protein [Gemmatimonadales bacterium]
MTRRAGSLLLFTITLAACGGGGLSGSYTPSGGAGFFEKMNFTSGKKVEITFMGQTRELGYALAGKKLKIISPDAGETQIFSMDGAGCFDGGGLLGKYCPSGGIVAVARAGSLTGTWEAKAPGGSFRLTFEAGDKVTLTMADEGGAPQNEAGTYEVSGDRITIRGPTGNALDLTRKGASLEGAFGGLTITFQKL